MDAYAVVYHDTDANKIFLNPLLFLQIALSEQTGASDEHKNRCILFLAIKMVHAFSHLVHPHISPVLRNQTEPKAMGGERRKKRVTQEKLKLVIFQDYGEMVEYDLLGGILDLYTEVSKPVAYRVDQLILYDHPTARNGRIVKITTEQLQITPRLASLRFAVFDERVDQPYRGYMGHFGLRTSTRFRPDPEADVINGDEEESDTDIPSPTF